MLFSPLFTKRKFWRLVGEGGGGGGGAGELVGVVTTEVSYFLQELTLVSSITQDKTRIITFTSLDS